MIEQLTKVVDNVWLRLVDYSSMCLYKNVQIKKTPHFYWLLPIASVLVSMLAVVVWASMFLCCIAWITPDVMQQWQYLILNSKQTTNVCFHLCILGSMKIIMMSGKLFVWRLYMFLLCWESSNTISLQMFAFTFVFSLNVGSLSLCVCIASVACCESHACMLLHCLTHTHAYIKFILFSSKCFHSSLLTVKY